MKKHLLLDGNLLEIAQQKADKCGIALSDAIEFLIEEWLTDYEHKEITEQLPFRKKDMSNIIEEVIKRMPELITVSAIKVKRNDILRVGKWNITLDHRGFYRAFRHIKGKVKGVYIGKVFDENLIKNKIKAKGYDTD